MSRAHPARSAAAPSTLRASALDQVPALVLNEGGVPARRHQHPQLLARALPVEPSDPLRKPPRVPRPVSPRIRPLRLRIQPLKRASRCAAVTCTSTCSGDGFSRAASAARRTPAHTPARPPRHAPSSSASIAPPPLPPHAPAPAGRPTQPSDHAAPTPTETPARFPVGHRSVESARPPAAWSAGTTAAAATAGPHPSITTGGTSAFFCNVSSAFSPTLSAAPTESPHRSHCPVSPRFRRTTARDRSASPPSRRATTLETTLPSLTTSSTR